nr:putative ribonuclease H-like domain-containing protein [Tanacetum cinerariifolium]
MEILLEPTSNKLMVGNLKMEVKRLELSVGNKMHKAFPLPVLEFPLAEEVPTASEESSHCQKKRDAIDVKIALLLKSKRNCTTSDGTGKKKGKTVTLTAEDMQKRKNDFMDVEIKQDDLNKKFLTSLAPEWLMHTIVWRNKSDLDTMSLDDLYNHLKVYESEVQKKSEPNSQNMAFISSAKHSKGNEEVSTASVSTASTNVPTASANVGMASISQDTACAYIASQSSGFDKSKVECFNCHKMGHFAKECRAPRSQDRGRRDNYRQGSKIEEQAPKALMEIDGVGWDWSYMENDKDNHALIADEETPTKFALMAKTSAESEELELIKKEKEGLDTKLTGFQTASKDLDRLFESQRLDKNKEGLGYSAIPPPPAQIYSPPKKDMSWTGLPDFADDTVTKTEASPSTILPKPFLKFVKANDNPTKSKTDKVETAKKLPVKKFPTAQRKFPTGSTKFSTADIGKKGSSQNNIDDKGYWDSGCSRHMTCNISYLYVYEPFDGGYVSFGQGGCKITSKGTIKTYKLEFENVYFVKDLKYNLFSVSQICDNKNSVLFTDSECIVLGRDFKLLDDDNVLLRTPRQHNMYSIDLNNIVPHKDLTCLVAKASADEGMLWHRRLGHLNFMTMNMLVRHNLVRGLPSKCFENDHTCSACLKEKQHKASCKSKLVNSVTKPLHTLHMDLFGPTSVSSISHKWYCLVVTDDFSRFT